MPAGVQLRLHGSDLIIQPAPAPGEEAGTTSLGATLAGAAGGPVVYDRRLGGYRALASAYRAIRETLEARHYTVGTEFDPAPALPFQPQVRAAPRPYQLEALDAWLAAGGRGVVVLPTGAGKTLVGLLVIARCAVSTLVVVPTLDLLDQWRHALLEGLGAPAACVGTFGGGRRDLRPITISTYDSAAIHTHKLAGFGLAVFDEVHHLPAATYRLAAQGILAPFRLGLSATPERGDGLEADLEHLVGPVVYARTPGQLTAHLARFREERLSIPLSPAERDAYDRAMAVYRAFVRRRRLRIDSPEDYQRLVVWPSAADPEARAAMLAHRLARRLAFNAEAKQRALVELLARHRADRVIIFSEYTSAVERVSRDLLIPCITHRTPAAERAALLEGFRAGRFSKLAAGRVLNEGVDVPDANVAIVLSGSGTRREHVQRLGRILRPKAGVAVLYELVTEGTSEIFLARRRHSRLGARAS